MEDKLPDSTAPKTRNESEEFTSTAAGKEYAFLKRVKGIELKQAARNWFTIKIKNENAALLLQKLATNHEKAVIGLFRVTSARDGYLNIMAAQNKLEIGKRAIAPLDQEIALLQETLYQSINKRMEMEEHLHLAEKMANDFMKEVLEFSGKVKACKNIADLNNLKRLPNSKRFNDQALDVKLDKLESEWRNTKIFQRFSNCRHQIKQMYY